MSDQPSVNARTCAEIRTVCPYCGRGNDRHGGERPENVPVDGDFSLCWSCRKVGVYVAGPLGLAVRKPTDDEAAEAQDDPQVRRAVGAALEAYDPDTAIDLWRGGSRGGVS